MSLMECYSIQVLDTCAFVLGKSFSSKPTLQKDLEHFSPNARHIIKQINEKN